MRVGLVRNAALGMVALVGLGMVGCDDNPTDFDSDETTHLRVNPSAMVVPAGVTSRLDVRTENAGNEPTWEDVTWQVDSSCGSGTITVDEHEDFVPDVEPPVVLGVTGGTTLGEVCITMEGAGETASTTVTVVGDSLEITNTPTDGEMDVFTQHQLSAALLSDAGDPVGPFDPMTDLAWESGDEEILTVDETGLVTAEAAGGATVTASWTDAGTTVSGQTTITVVVPAPELTSADAASYEVGEVVTLTGSGFLDGAHSIFVDGQEVDEFLEPTIVDETTATFRMPGGAVGEAEVTVGVAGTESDPVTVDRLDPTEPANDDTGSAPGITLPAEFYGFADADDTQDFFEFTLGAETTFDMVLDWSGEADMDAFITNAAVDDFPCTAATTAHPEEETCTVGAGTWYLFIEDFDSVPATYLVQLTPQ